MKNQFFEKPILNAPYKYPERHWELDKTGQPTQQIIEKRRPAEFITPIPKPKKQKGAQQEALLFDETLAVGRLSSSPRCTKCRWTLQRKLKTSSTK